MKDYCRLWTTSTSSPHLWKWVQWLPVCISSSSSTHAFGCTGGKKQVWNGAGIRFPACDALEQIARAENPRAVVRKGPDVPVEDQGINVLGTPMGHPVFVTAHLQRITQEHRVLLERIPAVQDVQYAWLILLHCAAARANYLLRVFRPALVRQFAENHDAVLWRCLYQILDIPDVSANQFRRSPAQCLLCWERSDSEAR